MIAAAATWLVFALVGLLCTLINLGRASRAYQAPMVPLTLAAGLGLGLFADSASAALMRQDWVPEAPLVGPALAANLLILLVFALLKVVFLLVCRWLWPAVLRARGSRFYYLDQDYGRWLLRREFGRAGAYLKGFLYAAVAVGGVVVALADRWPGSPAWAIGASPALGVLFLDALAGYLSGHTRSSFRASLLGQDDDDEPEGRVQVNYLSLREAYNNLFGDRILHDSSMIDPPATPSALGMLRRMRQRGTAGEQAVVRYFIGLLERGVAVDPSFVQSTLELLGGRSQLIANPFYRDLADYLVLPVADRLARHQKCLVVIGRDTAAEDIEAWLGQALDRFTGVPDLWRARLLDQEDKPVDVGLLRFRDLHNLRLLEKQAEFLAQVGLVVLIEPSRILATGQIGLGVLQSKLSPAGVTVAAVDRNCDGLVDSLSHAFRTSITEVFASLPPTGEVTTMYWEAPGPYLHPRILRNISRYLGVGPEIFTVARRFGVDNFTWISDERFPVVDMKWVVSQYYREICEQARLPISQEALGRAFQVQPALWSYPVRPEAFLVVEDEFRNLFELARVFGARATDQEFAHVICDAYLLRDFMVANSELFEVDPKAIPTIAADYARTERNITLRLVLQMFETEISADEARAALEVGGVPCAGDVGQQVEALIAKHCDVQDARLLVRQEPVEGSIEGETKSYLYIDQQTEVARYAQRLTNAYYLAENEQGGTDFVGASLLGHVYQRVLPGQFVTYAGKYYEVSSITPDHGVVLRRAADHIDERRTYRQLRRVHLSNCLPDAALGADRGVGQLRLTRLLATLEVATGGYLELLAYNDLERARPVVYEGIPTRRYRNRAVLRVALPGASAGVRFTIAVLLDEVFRSVYPDSWMYLMAVAVPPEPAPAQGETRGEGAAPDAAEGEADPDPSRLRQFQPELTGEFEPDSIYILEDSEIDLGLMVSVERNLGRFFGIILEYLNWAGAPPPPAAPDHPDDAAPGASDPIPAGAGDPPGDTPAGSAGSAGSAGPAGADAGSAGAAGPAGSAGPAGAAAGSAGSAGPAGADAAAEGAGAPPGEDGIVPGGGAAQAFEPRAGGSGRPDGPLPTAAKAAGPRAEAGAGEDGPGPFDVGGEDEATKAAGSSYLRFGGAEVDPSLDLTGAVEYLSGLGYGHNPLQQARVGGGYVPRSERDPSQHYCDFCGQRMIGEYDTLKDGRERCDKCAATAIRTVDEFRQVFNQVRHQVEGLFGIRFTVPVKVRVTNAEEISRLQQSGRFVFHPTPDQDTRAVGLAIGGRDGYQLLVETGTPRISAISTITHELTHIWQFANFPKAWVGKLTEAERGEIYEGMASWVAIQFMYLQGHRAWADDYREARLRQDNEYGRGLARFLARYPMSTDRTQPRDTPFRHIPPL
ncbi:MAG: hypothetical protein LBD51_10120 [Bifidobacteriaceae bacterium]|jgi:hypothetical protein|nr:hypothetical protein [Bifidobacteriaceae bacterium]